MINTNNRITGRRLGFTLLELLVVIGVIAIVVAIMIPMISSARTSARTASCAWNQRQIGHALIAYSSDNDGFLPPAYYLGPRPDGSVGVIWNQQWNWALIPYLDPGGLPVGVTFMACPERSEEPPVYTYGVNYPIASGLKAPPVTDDYVVSPHQTVRLSTLRGYMLSDAKGVLAITKWPGYFSLDTDTDGDGVYDSSKPEASSPDYFPYNGVAFPHPGRCANFLFSDGRVEAHSVAQWAKNAGNIWGLTPP